MPKRKAAKFNAIQAVWIVTREYEGLAGAGGVKDVSRQLAGALARSGRQVRVVLPLYGFMNPEDLGFKPLSLSFDVDMDYVGVERRERVAIWSGEQPGGAGRLIIYLVDAQRYREKRSVYTYTAEEEAANPLLQKQGSGHYDYFAMNVLLQKAAIDLMICLDQKPEIIHCHDGHTALLPVMIREIDGYRHYFRNTGVLVTIHNAGYGYHQDVDDLAFAQTITGLSNRVITDNLLEGSFDPLLAASSYAVMNTVSENYARELRETEDDAITGWLGHRLFARGVVLQGVTNGIDPADYDATKPEALGLPAAFNPLTGELAGKSQCREQLFETLVAGKLEGVKQDGFLENRPGQPLFTFIGRLTDQKGVDKLVGALSTLLPLDEEFQLLIQGTGAPELEEKLARLALAKGNRGRVCLLRGYQPRLANMVYAAGDFFLIPSRYEPCGLTDFIAQLFGNLPIVHHVGGLVKVEDGKTGFAYQEHSAAALMGAMQRGMRVFRQSPARLAEMQQQAVALIHQKFTWDKVVERYFELYRAALDLNR